MDMSKNGIVMRVSEEMMLNNSWFPKKGHIEEIPLTDDDRAEHARAVAAYEEIMSNSWINLGGYDYEFEVAPLKPRTRFVAEETDEEHMARWVAAGRPVRNPIREAFEQTMRSFRARVDGGRIQ